MIKLHVTEVDVFRTCRLYWYYSYREKLRPRQEPPSGPLWFGTGIHYALAQFYQFQRSPRQALYTWEGYQKGSVPLMEEILDHYEETYRNDLEKWEVVSVESPLQVKIPGTRVYLVGTFDLLVRDRIKKGLWIIDHKTRTTFDSDIEMNEQITGYCWLARELGLSVNGVIWNEIKKVSPQSNPRVQEFFRRTVVTKSSKELDRYGKDLKATAQELASKKTSIYPNPGWPCIRWACIYKTLCQTRRMGDDEEFLKQALFLTEKS